MPQREAPSTLTTTSCFFFSPHHLFPPGFNNKALNVYACAARAAKQLLYARVLVVSHYGEGHDKVLKLMLDSLSTEGREEAANAPDANGLTPLFFAQKRNNNPECLKELISARTRKHVKHKNTAVCKLFVFQIETRLLSIS